MSISAINNNGNHLSLIGNTAKNSADKIPERNDVKKQLIEHESPYLEAAKEIATGMIPIYGTIHEFQKGNIGWGIFGAITDVLTLVPIVGAGFKITSSLIRGGKNTVKGLQACVVSTDTVNATAKIMAKESSQQLAKNSPIYEEKFSASKFFTIPLHGGDNRHELLFNLSKKQARSISEKDLLLKAKQSEEDLKSLMLASKRYFQGRSSI